MTLMGPEGGLMGDYAVKGSGKLLTWSAVSTNKQLTETQWLPTNAHISQVLLQYPEPFTTMQFLQTAF
jgi:hypothetical protein